MNWKTIGYIFVLCCVTAVASCGGPKELYTDEPQPVVARDAEFLPYDGPMPEADKNWENASPVEMGLAAFPKYTVYWEGEESTGMAAFDVGRLMLKVELANSVYPDNLAPADIIPEGKLYCRVVHPDSETVALMVELPEKVNAFNISMPLSKRIAWSPDKPRMYDIVLIYEVGKHQLTHKTKYGYYRMDRDARYFRMDGQSIYIRGVFDPGRAFLSSGEISAAFTHLKEIGFNMYVGDSPLGASDVEAAAEAGMLVSWIDLSGDSESEEQPGLVYQMPSWMGQASLTDDEMSLIAGGNSEELHTSVEFDTGIADRNWSATILPGCAGDFEKYLDSLVLEEMGVGDYFWPEMKYPVCLAYLGLHDAGCPSPEVDAYRLINIMRGLSRFDGFVIPYDLYSDDIKPLLTDDFLIIDLLLHSDVPPVKAKRGSILTVPIRAANFKPLGDRGGAFYWRWDETGVEGRVNYMPMESKGIFPMAPLEIPAPNEGGKYRLRFEMIGFDGYVQAFNWLDVVVE